MSMILPIATMRLDDDAVATLEGAALDAAEDLIQTVDATAHERTQHRLRLLIKRLPQYLRHGEDDMPVDAPLMQHPADLADPVIDVDFGAAQAQRGLTTHGDAMLPWATRQTPIGDVAYLLRMPAREHLVDKPLIVGCIVARVDAFDPVPVLSKDLFENVPVA